ncbi:MAG: MdtA/MuxA family multidrug efflux RND transporter periplasmic adaptor subunit [Betaproteobacteria bacterium]|nr:MdtA/MuxA family multidrug efflux RND transporter periplasmic adaptor subunit [Betaproteobacteria bacterium]
MIPDLVSRLRSPRGRLFGGLLVLVLAAVLVAYFKFHGASSSAPGGGRRPPLAPVSVAVARAEDFQVWMTGLGTVTPLYTVTVHSMVDGQLMQVHFKEGQIVKAGDLLAEIDPRPFQVQLDQALAQLAHDRALLQNAKLDLSRYKALAATGAAPQQQLDTQVALVAQYEASILTDQAQVDNAKLQLVYSRITAPVSGRLGLRLVDPGNIIHTTDATGLVVLTQLSPITVIFPLPQDALPAILKSMKAGTLRVQAWDRSNTTRLAEGELLTVDNQVDVTTGMVKLRAQFQNSDNSLFPNQFVNARLQVDTLKNALVIPVAGVQQGADGPYAYVLNAQHVVSVHKLKLGPSDGVNVAIQEGLAPGDQVVTDGVDHLREGATVEISSRGKASSGS